MESSDSNHSHIRQTLDLARSALNGQQPEDAMELLRTVGDDVERVGGAVAAEHRLLLADAYAANGNPVADSLFEEALGLIESLEPRCPDLELRANDHFGGHLVCFGSRSAARERYETAKRIAIQERLGAEVTARIQLKLVQIALETDHDEIGLKNFATFKRAASQGHFTRQVQLIAWHQYCGQLNASQLGLRYGRNKAIVSEAYFKHILESARDLPA
jgi:hypothetical protein